MSAPAAAIRALGLALGFDAVGFGPAAPGPRDAFLREWLDRGYAGEMDWLARRVDERSDPRELLPGARSAITVGLVYEPDEPPGDGIRIARYAGGEDYHDVLRDRLRAFESAIEARARGPVVLRSFVDTGPVLERSVAARAGLGWIGKNTLLLNRRFGSYWFLGVILTDLDLDADTPEPDHCGDCRACLDACPTDAFPEPYVLDATRCLSYTTIEHRSATPESLRPGQGDRVFGCDVCQEVCPWNQRRGRERPADPLGLRARLAPRPEWQRATLEWLLSLDEEAWQAATRHTALRRARYRGLVRNALVAAGNRGDPDLVPALEAHVRGPDPMLAEVADWALARCTAGADRSGGSGGLARP